MTETSALGRRNYGCLGSQRIRNRQSSFPAQKNPDRNAYFGEEHIHTSWSMDAWLMGNRITGPDDALKYAQGQTIKHPMGYDIKVETPMDFMGVTDQSEYVGITAAANTSASAASAVGNRLGPNRRQFAIAPINHIL